MDEFQTYEYVVKQGRSGKNLVSRAMLITGYVFFVLAFLITGIVTKVMAPLFALAPIALWILIFFTWRYVNVEYEISMTSGIFTVSKIYGGRSRKTMMEFAIKNCSMIAPLTHARWSERAELFRAETVCDALSSPDAPDAYFAAFESENGKKEMLYFEATQKALRICRYYNSAATVVAEVSK